MHPPPYRPFAPMHCRRTVAPRTSPRPRASAAPLATAAHPASRSARAVRRRAGGWFVPVAEVSEWRSWSVSVSRAIFRYARPGVLGRWRVSDVKPNRDAPTGTIAKRYIISMLSGRAEQQCTARGGRAIRSPNGAPWSRLSSTHPASTSRRHESCQRSTAFSATRKPSRQNASARSFAIMVGPLNGWSARPQPSPACAGPLRTTTMLLPQHRAGKRLTGGARAAEPSA